MQPTYKKFIERIKNLASFAPNSIQRGMAAHLMLSAKVVSRFGRRVTAFVYLSLVFGANFLLYGQTAEVSNLDGRSQKLKARGTPGTAVDPKATVQALSDAGRDSLLKVYSIDDLLEYKDFYEHERFRLERERVRLREKGVRDMEMFLQSHPQSKVLDKVIARLAELYYENSIESYTLAQEQYSAQLTDYEKGALLKAPEEPSKDFKRTLELYERIIQEFPQSPLRDDAFYNKAFLLEDLGQRNEAVVLYEKFVQDFSDSRYIPDALFRIAEYYFNPPVHDIERAVDAYKRVLSYNESPKYDEALYRLGWCYYKLSDYPNAISHFTLLVDDLARSQRLDPKNRITSPSLAEESIEYIGIAFLDYKGAEAAADYLNNLGGREFGIDILRKIGDVYMTVKEEYEQAVEAYRLLLRLYPLSTEAPIARAKIAECYRSLGDEQVAYLQRDTLFQEYRQGSAWWDNNTTEAARIQASQLVERALRENINLLLKRAEENDDTSLYAQAVYDSRKYLSAFPKDSSASQIHWNMALTLDAKLALDDEAYAEYLNISNLYWNSRFRKMAAENAVALAQEMAGPDSLARPHFMPLNLGEMKETMQAGTPEGTRHLRRALHLEQKELNPGETKLATALGNYIKLFPHEPETAERLAQAGALYYNKDNFSEGIKYFKTLLRHFPENPEAEYAEYLLMESYFGKVDYKSSEIVAKRIKMNSGNRDYVHKAEQRLAESIFLQAEGLADVAEHLKAAEEYRRVYEEVPAAEFADLALYNAGLEFDQAREYPRAVETYDILVAGFPKSPHYLASLNNMAHNYGTLNDYRNASLTFERLANEEQDSTKAEVSLFNASVFCVRAEDWERAIRVNRQFVSRYPNAKDADGLYYDMANYYLKLNDFENANAVYGEYAEKFPDSPRVVETFYRRGEYFENKRETDAAKTEYEKAIAKSQAFQKRKMDANEFFAAEALFRLTEIKYREFAEIRFKLPQIEMEQAKERKKNALLDIVDGYARVTAYGTIRLYESTYKIGDAYEEFAFTWVTQEVPEIDEARRIVAKKEINQTAAELYERALQAYKHAARALAKVAALYGNQTATFYAANDTTIYDPSGRVAPEDTTLRVAQRWVERSRGKISEVIYNMAEINFASVQQLLDAPVPENMGKITALEFRNQLLGKFVKPLIANIVTTHQRNLAEADTLSLQNSWVEKSRRKIATTENLLSQEYANLSWQALSQYKAGMSDYKTYVSASDIRAIEMREEMANLIDFSRSFAKAAMQSYSTTLERVKAVNWSGSELDDTQTSTLGYAYRFATAMDSLAKAANQERRAFETVIREGKERASTAYAEALQEAVLTFEDNYFSLSEGVSDVLQQGFEIAQQYKIENEWSQKITLLLVRSEPEKYAGLLGLEIREFAVPSDETWLTTTTHYAGWVGGSDKAASWYPAQNLGEGQHFGGYGARRLWLTGNGTATSDTAIRPVAMVNDTITNVTSSLQGNVVYFYKTFQANGLPISGQIQLFADDSYHLFVNGEYAAQFTKTLNEEAVTHIHEISNFLRSGENTIALEVRDNDKSGGILEAVVFVKCLPEWEKREAQMQAKKQKQEENLIIERGVLPNNN